MPRDSRYDPLFEPVRIGPVTARNRFYQVPHATGMGHAMPHALAAMREVKAEGGWAVVCTEYCSIHPSSDDSPYAFATLWDEGDVRAQALMAEAVHRHEALAGIELWHGGHHAPNRLSREMPMSPSGLPLFVRYPVQSRAMDRDDIRNLRRWQTDAARRAKQAGFDIVYVYAGHDYLPFQFLSKRVNQRCDEYGGSLENRVRLLREMIEDTKEAVGDRCAVAVRLAVDELLGDRGFTSDREGREVVEMLAELPDLWDVNLNFTYNDSLSARFSEEAFQEPYVRFVKQVTSKPVVGVGRFTSPDTMVSQIRRGVLDFIGAARPSIADPFLPRKIEEGREDEIRECIGCNVCRSANNEGVPLRCTQNPTMGEEWRRGWHPERVPPRGSDTRILVVGAGPAGLECALTLGRRGYEVTLAEATTELGGRVSHESRLPGLATWARVRDHRVHLLAKMNHMEIYRDSALTVQDILEVGCDHVVLATGARWRRDGVGQFNSAPVSGLNGSAVYTPEDVIAGVVLADPVVVYDDDHYYMGGCLAEMIRRAGHDVTLVTPATEVSSWTQMTNEQERIQARLLELGVTIRLTRTLTGFDGSRVEFACIYTGRPSDLPCASLVLVTSRAPDDALYRMLAARPDDLRDTGIRSIRRIGDCDAPGAIVHAVYAGHRCARELDETTTGELPFRRERIVIGPGTPHRGGFGG